MPRYYFHLTDRNQGLNNHEGIDMSGHAAAHDEAMTPARDLKHGEPPFDAGAFPCRLEPVLFQKTRLAQSCR
jgi:hypothetical protein